MSVWGAVSGEQSERLEARLFEPTTLVTAPVQMHLARMFRRARHRVGSAAGEAIFARGTTLGVRRFGPTKAQYFALAGASSEKARTRRGRSIDLAEVVSDLDLKRGLIAGLRVDGEINQGTRAGLDHLVRLDPDLAPARAWVAAA